MHRLHERDIPRFMTASDIPQPVRIAAMYRFRSLPEFEAMRAPLAAFCCARGIRGTLLLAPEGLNGTVAGSGEAIAELVAHLGSLIELGGTDVKYSEAPEMPFHRMKVRLKREIVTMGVEDLDPSRDAGTHVAPLDWNALIADPDTIVIDTRNAYETSLGRFERAVVPETRTFREFPDWAVENREQLDGRKVAMYCTGGIRCEKATAFLKTLGLDRVYHLQGGILKYLEEVPAGESLWTGECFVFDERVSVGHGLGVGEAELCRACRRPLTAQDRDSLHYREGVSCAGCIAERSEDDRARYAERHRQVALAQERGRPRLIGR